MRRQFSVVGLHIGRRWEGLNMIRPGHALALHREPTNEYDPNAIGVWWTGEKSKGFQLGYVPRGLAAEIAPLIDAGIAVKVFKPHVADALKLRNCPPAVLELQWEDPNDLGTSG